MKNTNAVAIVMVEGNKLLDKLILETSISVSERTWLGVYKTKLGSAFTRKDEDMRFIEIFSRWALHLHKQ